MERSASERAADIAALAERVEGELLLPPDEGFEGARAVWNARIDRRPAAVLRCAGPHDVVAGVRFAREENVPLSVKGGGHSYAGSAACDGCLLIDLGPMGDVRIDPDERTARVGAEETAFPHREALYGFHVLAGWTDPGADDEHMAWVRSFHEAMAPFSTGGVYVNLVSEDEHDRVRGAYGDNHERLAEVKARWDPENLFRAHPPIEPAP